MPRLGWTNDDDDNAANVATVGTAQASEQPAQAAQTAHAAPLSTAERWERAQTRLDRAIEEKRRAGLMGPLVFMFLIAPLCYALTFAILTSAASGARTVDQAQSIAVLFQALNVLAAIAAGGGLIWLLVRIARRVSAGDEVEAARAELQKVETQLNREAMARR